VKNEPGGEGDAANMADRRDAYRVLEVNLK